MKSAIGWFAFGMVIALARVTEAQMTCYECIHTETKESLDGYESTCAEPFVPDGVETCSGTACLIMWHDFGSLGYGNNRTCYTDPPMGSTDQCLMLNQFQTQYQFFIYEGLCCFNMNNSLTHNGKLIYFLTTVCLCDKENCNGDIPSYVTTPVPPTTTQPTGENSTANATSARTMTSGKRMNTTTTARLTTTKTTSRLTTTKTTSMAAATPTPPPSTGGNNIDTATTTKVTAKSSGKWMNLNQPLFIAALLVAKFMISVCGQFNIA